MRVAANIRWERMRRWRIRCHRDILHVDLDEDLKSEASGMQDDFGEPIALNRSKGDRPRLGFGRFASKAGGTPQKLGSREDKGTVPSPSTTNKFIGTVEDMFKTELDEIFSA